MSSLERDPAGATILRIVDVAPSLTLLDPEGAVGSLDRIQRVFVVGASGAGKTTLLAQARDHFADDITNGRLSIPIRVSTRKPRLNDDALEQECVLDAQFDALVEAGALNPHWTKPVSDGSAQRYGFRTTHAPMTVYSANDALLGPSGAFDALPSDSLLLEVWAPDEIRAARLAARSPDLASNAAEMRTRLSSVHHDSTQWPRIRVSNGADSGRTGIGAALTVLGALVSGTRDNV